MHIGEIGDNFKGTQKIGLFDKLNLLEFDLLVIDLDSYSSMASSYTMAQSFYAAKKTKLEQFHQIKNLPIIYFARGSNTIQLNINGNTYPRQLHDIAPIPFAEIITETGNKFDIIKNTPFTSFFEDYINHFQYKTYFNNNVGIKILQTPHTNFSLSSYGPDFVFLPRLKDVILDKSIEEKFLNDLLKISNTLNRKQTTELPEWTKKYFLPNELTLVNKLKELKSTIGKLQLDLDNQVHEIETYQAKKKLVTATGNELEQNIETLLKEIGFEILEVEQNRDDLIVKYNDNIAVIEIKGITKSAAEKHANQLEKWTADYLSKHEAKVKGILIVNAYKDEELNKRVEPVFPNQMHKYSIQREHCLITTTQLLGMYFKIKEQPDMKDSIIESLFTTVGVYKDFDNWTEFITYKAD